ncbi:MAG: hypothetical protein R2825_08575 [Saprospiraceae bacterium]
MSSVILKISTSSRFGAGGGGGGERKNASFRGVSISMASSMAWS